MVGVCASVSLLSLQIVRLAFGKSLSQLGCLMSVLIALVVFLVEYALANAHYSSYTEANGLQYDTRLRCGSEFTGCTPPRFNFLFLVYPIAVVPALVESIRYLHIRRRTRDSIHDLGVEASKRLTSFERFCLDHNMVSRIVRDLEEPYQMIVTQATIKCVGDHVVTACGFTMIQDRFLIRTKDLTLLLFARFLPRIVLRTNSVVIWELQHAEGHTMLQVKKPRSVFLRSISKHAIHADIQTSIIHGCHRPLA